MKEKNATQAKPKPVIGEHPDCICNGDTITLWDCNCPECKEIRR